MLLYQSFDHVTLTFILSQYVAKLLNIIAILKEKIFHVRHICCVNARMVDLVKSKTD